MKRGRKFTPTRILKARGSRYMKHRADAELICKRPRCPSWLTGRARKEWHRISPKLESLGIIAETDGPMLALYCTAYADYIEALGMVKTPLVKTQVKTIIKKDGTKITTGGNVIQHPMIGIRNQAWNRLLKVCAEFGMSPASRAGVSKLPRSRTDANKAKFFPDRA